MSWRGEISWNAAQVARLRKAVSVYNRTVDRMEKSGIYDLVPKKTTVAAEKTRIHSRDQLYQREKELRRILKSVKPDAWETVEVAGAIVPKYLIREIKLAERTVNAERRKTRMALFPGWDEMNPWEKAEAQASGNIGDLQGEYTSPDDLEDLITQKYAETYAAYFDRYIETWHEHCLIRQYEDAVVENIEWLMDNRPDAVRQILDRGYQQAKIEYIWDSEFNDFTELLSHHHAIVDFWEDMREYYE